MEINVFGKKLNLTNGNVAVVITVTISAVGLLGVFINKGGGHVFIDKKSPQVTDARNTVFGRSSEKDPAVGKEPIVSDEIKVYILGCVKNPGVYTVKKGQIILDVINAAGGATEEADLENVNLVYKLKDNVMIRLNAKREMLQNSVDSGAKSGDYGKEAGLGVEMVQNSGGVIFNEDNGNGINLKININTAPVNMLVNLPGVGPETAKDIVSYREKNGNFKKTTDIMKVPGIKESRFSKLEEFITVD